MIKLLMMIVTSFDACRIAWKKTYIKTLSRLKILEQCHMPQLILSDSSSSSWNNETFSPNAIDGSSSHSLSSSPDVDALSFFQTRRYGFKKKHKTNNDGKKRASSRAFV